MTAFVVAPDAASPDDGRKKVMFFRNFARFRGGHLKVWDYYNHVAASGTHMPYVAFAHGSVWDETNPWNRPGQKIVEKTIEPDVLFVAGRDWLQLDEEPEDVPVINFVQSVRHGDASKERYRFLERRAIRICVDPAVELAIHATGQVRGPVFTIQNGTDVAPATDAKWDERDLDLLILGPKRPETAHRLADRLRGVGHRVVDSLIPRPELLEAMRRAKATLFLPEVDEGAYLPPLEGMALGTLVICPDHLGTSYCVDGENAFRPPYDDDHLLEVVTEALSMDAPARDERIAGGSRTARRLTLDAERSRFLDILRRVEDLWRDES